MWNPSCVNTALPAAHLPTKRWWVTAQPLSFRSARRCSPRRWSWLHLYVSWCHFQQWLSDIISPLKRGQDKWRGWSMKNESKGAQCRFGEEIWCLDKPSLFSWLNKLNRQTLKENTISYCLTLFICGGPCHLFSFKHLSFLREQLLYSLMERLIFPSLYHSLVNIELQFWVWISSSKLLCAALTSPPPFKILVVPPKKKPMWQFWMNVFLAWMDAVTQCHSLRSFVYVTIDNR